MQTESPKDYKIYDYFCDRHRLLGEEIRRPDSPCLKQRRMKDISTVETLSHHLQEVYGFNLVHVSTKAALRYIHIDSCRSRLKDKKTLKLKVLKKLEAAIKTQTDPITGARMGRLGITEPIMCDLIELTATGKIEPKSNPLVPLSVKEIGLLDHMRILAIGRCKTDHEKEDIVALYKKIRGMT